MSALIVLYGSSRTPRLEAYSTAVSSALDDCGAVLLDDDADLNLRLHDGAEVEFDTLEKRQQVHVSFDEPCESAIDLLYVLTDRTASIATINRLDDTGEFASPQSPACALPSTGRMMAHQQNSHAVPVQIANRETFGVWLMTGLIANERAAFRPSPLPAVLNGR